MAVGMMCCLVSATPVAMMFQLHNPTGAIWTWLVLTLIMCFDTHSWQNPWFLEQTWLAIAMYQ